VRDWDAERVARACGARLRRRPQAAPGPVGPLGVCIDSRELSPGELFVGLRGEHQDGGGFAAAALDAGAWGVLVAPGSAPAEAQTPSGAVVLLHEDPLAALGALARAWRRELGAGGSRVVAITGSTGKTSTKDILAALLATSLRTAATPANLNTEIGVPLAILAAGPDSECLVLELAMRGPGQIASLTAIAEPDVGVIVNVGPAHLELLGSLEAIAAAKAELIAGLAPGATAVVPHGERLLAPHLREAVRTITFGGEGADVRLLSHSAEGRVEIAVDGGAETVSLWPSFTQAHNISNLLAAVAAARALGLTPSGSLDVRFSAGRGQRLAVAGGVTVVDDCYNANPMSMRAAIDDLQRTPARRRVAVLGDMLELGEQGPALHREIGAYAGAHDVELLVGVGSLGAQIAASYPGESRSVPDAAAAAALLAELLAPGDVVLVKGSRGVALEQVVEALAAAGPGRGQAGGRPRAAASGAGGGRR
jgi:UDP-N-acetylmuramoyl-tripeptide--D-alanyl-D-alanine ligase